MDILQRGWSMVSLKKWTVRSSVLLSKESQEETFFDRLDKKECFLDLESEVLTWSKKSTFCKGVSPWFLSKNRPFLISSLLNKKAWKKHFLIFWIEKKVFWTSKVKFSQSRKKSTFCKGVSPWCSSKNLSFSHWFFWAKKARKKHFLIFWIEKNALWTSKVKFSQSRKKSTFYKGVSSWFFSKNRPLSHIFFKGKKARKKHFLIFWIENNAF